MSEDEDAPGGAVAPCCSPVISSPPLGFPPTLQKVPPTQHLTLSHRPVCEHAHQHNSAAPLKLLLLGETVCSLTLHSFSSPAAVCSAACGTVLVWSPKTSPDAYQNVRFKTHLHAGARTMSL